MLDGLMFDAKSYRTAWLSRFYAERGAWAVLAWLKNWNKAAIRQRKRRWREGQWP